MHSDQQYMQRCLDLAVKGMGHVAPNPMVGCVIVHEGNIIGEGFHEQYGGPHAEVHAITSVVEESLLHQSTLYVNLEPCSHYGKTPPCAGLIVSKRIPKVVIGSYDPNPLVAGKGIALLQQHGVEVTTELLRNKCDFLNRRFITFHTQHRPYVILKWAQSQDGFMAPAEAAPYWLTGRSSRQLVHQWRSEELAIMVGKNTVLTDNPALTVREWQGNNPIRITIDRHLSIPASSQIFNDAAPTLVFNERENRVDGHTEKIRIDFNADVLPQILDEIYQRNILSLMVEGGAVLLHSFIKANLWDEARIFTTGQVLKEGLKAPPVIGREYETARIENDVLQVRMR